MFSYRFRGVRPLRAHSHSRARLGSPGSLILFKKEAPTNPMHPKKSHPTTPIKVTLGTKEAVVYAFVG